MFAVTRIAAVLLTTLALAQPATADVIAETGTGNPSYGGAGLLAGQWLANSFSISDAYTITDINGWISGYGTFRLGIREVENGLPGALLYSTGIAVDQRDNDWIGASGLAWNLNAGNYFVSFDVPTGYTMLGGMGPVNNPIGSAAYTLNGNWYARAGSQLGFQIFGDLAPVSSDVPEPSSLALTGLAIAALAAARRRRV